MNNYIEKISLDGAWKLYEAGTDKAYPVTVPGSVLSGLLDNNVIEDPFYGTNEYPTRELLRKDYTFERTFDFDGDDSLDWDLCMDGIDTIAEVFINGKRICHTDNMHRRYVVNITKNLKKGTNEIRINFTSPIKYMDAHVPAKGKEINYTTTGAMTNCQYIRKAHSMFGWDWGPQLPDIGIFRSIYLKGYEDVSLEYIQVIQEHEENKVYITVNGDILSRKGKEERVGFASEKNNYALLITVKDPDGVTICENVLDDTKIEIENPKLWWPAGLGAQPLYTVSAALINLKDEAFKGNTVTEKIGLRTLTVSKEKDEWGEEFAFMVNGVKFFSKGADYIPEDCVYSRITRDRIKFLIDSSIAANYNTLRVWGGGYYPGEDFMELCDESGIIIWQDFMYACNIYELTKEFKETIIEETKDNVRRLRNHASLALWCGNNEVESAWVNWGGFKDHSKALKKDYLEIFEDIIPKIVEKEDGTRFYWPSSPSSVGHFEDPDNDDVGDRHYWEVWHGEKPFTDYEKYYFRFLSEFGFQSFPEMATIRKFAKEGDFNIFSPVMESHQKNGTANGKILHYISENFLYPKDFESLLYISQVLQGMAMKYGVEHFRRNRGRCMGTLYWQINDNWPVASWSSIDYYGRWKALHYMARHFYADIAGSVRRTVHEMTPFVQNETFTSDETNVKLFVKTMDNEVVFKTGQKICTEKFSVGKGETVDIASAVAHRENATYFEAVFFHSDGTVTKQVEPILEYKHMELPKVQINLSAELIDDTHVKATISADKFAAFVALMCEEANIIWDDNYFFITDNETVKITGTIQEPVSNLPVITVKTIADSYEK